MPTCANCGTTSQQARDTCVVCGSTLSGVPEPAANADHHADPDPHADPDLHADPDSEVDPEGPAMTAAPTDTAGPTAPPAPTDTPRQTGTPGPSDIPGPTNTDRAGAAPGMPGLPPPPGPDAVLVDSSARNWGLLAHVAGFVASSLGGLGFLGPLLVWLLKRDEHPFISHHAAEAFNFQLSMFLYGLLLVVASLPVVTMLATIPLGVIGFVLWVVLPIVAAIRAANGEAWSYPLTIGFLRP